MSDELWRRSATALAASIASGEVSAREVLDAHLARVEAVNPSVNAVVAVLAEEARAAAAAADEAVAAGAELGPFHGVPLSVKENIDLAGTPTTNGVVALAEAIAEVDAPSVERMRAAGAIPFVRTNLPDFGLRWHTDNALRGATRNAWDPTRTPGGSSGGEAVALATGMSPMGLGNDLGGSLRIPSAFAGTCALKPTVGRVPEATCIEPVDPTFAIQLMAVEGPMARHVADLAAMFPLLAGHHHRDPRSVDVPLEGRPAPRRVAIVAEPPGGPTDPAVAAAVRAAGEALADAGYECHEVLPPRLDDAHLLWAAVVGGDTAVIMPLLAAVVSDDARRFLELGTEAAPPPDLAGLAAALHDRHAVARQWEAFLAETPLVVAPVSCAPPFVVGDDIADVEGMLRVTTDLRVTLTVNLLGVPAVAMNAGVVDGRPQGIQIIGGRFREDLCLAAAAEVEARLGVPTPIDPRS